MPFHVKCYSVKRGAFGRLRLLVYLDIWFIRATEVPWAIVYKLKTSKPGVVWMFWAVVSEPFIFPGPAMP
jgi:hypothetical protein